MMRSPILIGWLALSATWACGGHVEPSATGLEAGAGSGNSSQHSSNGEDHGTVGDAGAPHGSDAACFAACSIPAGTMLPITTVEQAYAALEGRWQLCGSDWSPAYPGAPSDVVGVEYGPATITDASSGCGGLTGTGAGCSGGAMYYLVASSNGPVRGKGFAYQLTYDVSSDGASLQLNMHPLPNSGFGGSFEYSPCPTELLIGAYPAGSATLVPVY